jgi:hypothetical protein
MDRKIKQAIQLHQDAMKRLPEISKKVSDPALAYSIAKYYPALERLAKE